MIKNKGGLMLMMGSMEHFTKPMREGYLKDFPLTYYYINLYT